MGVEVYTAPNCSFCTKAKQLLFFKGIKYTTVDVRESPEGLQRLRDLGLRTVPQIWIDGKHIGGYTELHTYLRELNIVTGA